MVLKFLKIFRNLIKIDLDNDSDFLFSNYKEIAYLKFYENIKDDGEVILYPS
jgi:hypothetical protein